MIKENVKGERIIAAILDGIFLGIATFIVNIVVAVAFGAEQTLNFFISSNDINQSMEGLFSFILVTSIVALVIGFVYYALIPAKSGGQTLGKKLLGIKVINELGENPSLKVHTIRAINIWDVYISVPLLAFYLVNFVLYSVLSTIAGLVILVLVIVSLIMIITDQRSQGLHDRMVNTFVVDKRYDPNREAREAAASIKDWADVEGDSDEEEFMDEFEQYSNKEDATDEEKDPWEK
ncbi:MAG: RDD family protein [Candidatus Izemoplasmataceae bacterium]